MPTSPTYPGVYIEEIPSGVRTIVGVATSITAFIGRAQRGPVNEPTIVNGFADFERMFGGLWNESRLGFAVRDFFLNGGGQAVIVRLFQPIFTSSEDQQKARAAAQEVAIAAANVVGDTPLDDARAKVVNDAAKAKAAEYDSKTDAEKQAAKAILAAVNAEAKKDKKVGDVNKAIDDAAQKATSAAQEVGTAATNPAGTDSNAVLDAAKANDIKDKAKAKAEEYNTKSDVEKAAAQAILATVNAAAKVDANVGEVTTAIDDAVKAATATAQAVGTAAANAVGDTPLDDARAKVVNDAAKAKAAEYDSKTDAEKQAAKAILAAVNAEAKKDKKVGDVVKNINKEVNVATPVVKARLTVGKTNTLELEAAYEGKWGNNLRARVDYDRPRELPESFKAFDLALSDLFNLTVRDMKTGATEVFRNLTVKQGPRAVDKTLESGSKLVRAAKIPGGLPESTDEGLSAEDKNIPPFSNVDVAGSKRSVGVTVKASDGSPLTQEVFVGEGKAGKMEGLYALERLFAKDGLFNLLCIPPYKFDDPSGDVDTNLLSDAAAYCEKRRAMLLIDPPSSWKTKTDARDNFVGGNSEYPGIRNKNAALFFPRLIQPNPLRDDQMEDFVPCGAVAGIFARTDVQRGVWKAPAGIEATLVGVPKLSVPMTNEENGELNPLGINCLRAFPATGRIVWGSRTLRGADQLADEWKYIPVRRTALFIEESLYRGTQWVVFEPNDEPLWAQIRLNVGAFMQNMFRQGAFQGTTPREAYFVKCDKETTTQNDINLGIVNIVVGFAPLKPAEFVIIKLQQMAGQIEV